MDVKIANCPNCGATLHFDENNDSCFCSHCGTQVFKDSNNKTIVVRKIDDARIIEAELKDRQHKRALLFCLIIVILLLLFGIVIFKLLEAYFRLLFDGFNLDLGMSDRYFYFGNEGLKKCLSNMKSYIFLFRCAVNPSYLGSYL